MSSPKEIYRKECESHGVPPNSGVLRMLPDSIVNLSGVSVMHLGRNFLGDRGVIPFISVIGNASSLHTLNLRENGLSNDGVRALCRGLRHLPALKVLELSGNPFTFLAARRLVRLCEDSAALTVVGVEDTLMTEPLKLCVLGRIHDAVMRRESRRQLSRASSIGGSRGRISPADGSTQRIVADEVASLRKVFSSTAASLKSAQLQTTMSPSGAALATNRNEPARNDRLDDDNCDHSTNCLRKKEEEHIEEEEEEKKEEVVAAAAMSLPVRPPLAPPPMENSDHHPSWLDVEDNDDDNNNDKSTSKREEEKVIVLPVEPRSGVKAPGAAKKIAKENPAGEEEMLQVQASKRGDTVSSEVDLNTRAPPYRASIERVDNAFGHSSASSFTLEVCAADREGKLIELAASTKEDDFLDLLFGSGLE